jgi:hypothetical protein
VRFFLLLIVLVACGEPAQAPPPAAGTPSSPATPAQPPVAQPPAALPGDPPKPVDLSKLSSNIPKATTDTFTFRPLRVERIPDAPQVLMDAAEREQGISRFCYQEFGQKNDPRLRGAVALVVTMTNNAVSDVKVGAEQWTSASGRAVDRCLLQKVGQAWKLLPDQRVADGRYVVQLQFRPS